MIPLALIREARSAPRAGRMLLLSASRNDAPSSPRSRPPITAPDKTERGRDSRDPPNMLAGARARIEAFVSTLFLRRRFEDEAKVRMLALSDKTLFAVAVWYVVG